MQIGTSYNSPGVIGPGSPDFGDLVKSLFNPSVSTMGGTQGMRAAQGGNLAITCLCPPAAFETRGTGTTGLGDGLLERVLDRLLNFAFSLVEGVLGVRAAGTASSYQSGTAAAGEGAKKSLFHTLGENFSTAAPAVLGKILGGV